ncbi:uncharacterized protein BDR25DRAFT_351645 [Lindgomyces ingoldianus]|uniref:Uncharacterized protein n=1 Tax=Lindgomyces ingoldianus TaxID=673940 RepID=A0ACB6R4B5_9PLEO|nr:uncharacterized protein BDR25DRAFT_351645 [Lindgomyces ingoldianus]KAF2474099.1 hypothetical protein BDR25DRAFT_351645 [Lindgomyces ingoldianus]
MAFSTAFFDSYMLRRTLFLGLQTFTTLCGGSVIIFSASKVRDTSGGTQLKQRQNTSWGDLYIEKSKARTNLPVSIDDFSKVARVFPMLHGSPEMMKKAPRRPEAQIRSSRCGHAGSVVSFMVRTPFFIDAVAIDVGKKFLLSKVGKSKTVAFSIQDRGTEGEEKRAWKDATHEKHRGIYDIGLGKVIATYGFDFALRRLPIIKVPARGKRSGFYSAGLNSNIIHMLGYWLSSEVDGQANGTHFKKQKKKHCAIRESNPGQLLVRQLSYR